MKVVIQHLHDGGEPATFIEWQGCATVNAAATKLGLVPLNLIVRAKTMAA
jgi:hypothetical protein